ncbi:hypothetical protein JOF55_000392 [Haloactinomyces albus]|uniref:DUF2188 domain-containing protein n=2 Tax=Haloactinomyces albus TaxID=1352928 RepID=A0AAE3ZAS7_9ACTN|nr:hypothetical protein [Haloactinomyces albus]
MSDRILKPRDEGGWKLAVPGVAHVDHYFGTRAEGVAHAKDAMRGEGGGELWIHDSQDAIVETISVTTEQE